MSSLLNHRHLIPLLHSSKIYITILSLFCLSLFISGIGGWDLWKPDEPRYAQVAQEMVKRGDWISLHLNGQPYFDKPPLFFWLTALSAYLWGGFTSFSARFPSGLLGSLTILITFFIGKRLYNSRTGFLSGLILATSLAFANHSVKANLDATLTFFVTGSLYCFLQSHAWQNRKDEERRGIHRVILYGFYICMALATLTKGPVGFLLPLLVSLGYLLIRRDWKGVRRMNLLTGMLLFLGIVLAWYLPSLWRGGLGYLDATLFTHTIDRYVKGWSHPEPFYYYLFVLPYGFMPWIFFLPTATAFEFSKKREGFPKEFLFLSFWFVAGFLFFSLSKDKRVNYILPLYPALSVLVGNFWNTYLSGDPPNLIRKTWTSLPIYLLITLFFFLGLAFFGISIAPKLSAESSIFRILAGIARLTDVKPKEFPYISYKSFVPFAFFFLGSSISLFLFYKWKHKFILFLLIVVTIGMSLFYTARGIYPLVNPLRSTRYISQEIQQIMGSGDKLAVYRILAYPYNFYTGIVPILTIEEEGEIKRYFSSPERIFCILRYEDYAKLVANRDEIPIRLIIRKRVELHDLVLVSNR